jgi:hypothetical protein
MNSKNIARFSILVFIVCIICIAAFTTGCGSLVPAAAAQRQCGQMCVTPTPTPIPVPGNLIPFPAIDPNGSTVTLEPGDYDCPPAIPTNTRIIGHGSIMGTEIFSINQPVFEVGPISTVRIHCSTSLTLRSVTNVQISGVIFDFGLNANGGAGFPSGLVLDGITYSRFDMGVYNTAGPGIKFITTDGQIVGNNFDHLLLWNCFQGMWLSGSGSFAITWNMFHDVQVLKSTDYGIATDHQVDTNIFDSVRVAFLPATARGGVILNLPGTVIDTDNGGNIFHSVMVDSLDPTGFQGYSVLLNGFTMGNKITITFGLVPESHKFLARPGFTHTDTINRLTEHL